LILWVSEALPLKIPPKELHWLSPLNMAGLSQEVKNETS